MLRKIKIYNTLSGKKEDLSPLHPGQVRLYACGVTVYDDCHIGHAMQAIFFDVIRNYLLYAGYEVVYVRNFTDVDDKIIMRAESLGISPKALAEKMIDSSQEDLQRLGVKAADYEPRVSQSIPEIISMIANIIANGHAYASSNGDVYFRVRSKKDYGKLSNRRPDELRSGSRDIVRGEKEDELDFALWKSDQTPDASWPSPWGQGRPGWHIECSAMAKKYLGNSFDLHGGGRDLVFPHHENEIAQSEAANDCPYASVWVHSGLLTLAHQKMSKSLGNVITIKDFLKQWPAEVLRLGYLQNHYRSNVDFSLETFKKCRKRLLYYYETLKALDCLAADSLPLQGMSTLALDSWRESFHQHMSDDFNTPATIALINTLMRQANQLLKQKKNAETMTTAYGMALLLREWGKVLGLFMDEPKSFLVTLKQELLAEIGLAEAFVLETIAKRQSARQAKDWQTSDSLRQELLQKGILLQDGLQETEWTIAVTDED